jgi:8-amino-7-oxononanoate synthase
MSLDDLLLARLAELDAAHLRRFLKATDASLHNFASNDYLGLMHHPALAEAVQRAMAESGAGSGASRLITGTDSRVLELEQELAAWKEKEAGLVFSSGFAAALGAIPALVGTGDAVILDKLCHASLIDGARLSGATVRTFPHGDLDRLKALLEKTTGQALVVTESIFSMDGDAADLSALVELKDRFGAWLLVDEAHATGLYGGTGAGRIAEAGLSSRVEIILGTFSKALGSVGGYIAGSRVLVDWLINRARSFVFSTALPPGVIAASHAAVRLVQTEEGIALRQRLRHNIAQFQAGLPGRWSNLARPAGAIQPLLVGEASAALELASRLRYAGFLIPAIRYPTVPRGAARLRVTLSAALADKSIDALNRVLASVASLD